MEGSIMAHTHAADKNYYLDQVCALGACASLGVVAILMFTTDKVALLLAPGFLRTSVLWGGITLLVVVMLRGIALWRQAGRVQVECDHDHTHEHRHHDEHCEHQHEHVAECGYDHSHAWLPVKYVFLMLPLTLYLLELPNAAFSADWANKQADQSVLEGPGHAVGNKGAMVLGFRELSDAAQDESKRNYFEGHTVKLKGMFVKTGSDKEFTLMRLKMNCCAADVVPMQVRIISEDKVGDFARTDWVEVSGKVEFRKVAGKEKYYAVLLTSSDKVQKIEPDPTPYD
jgi:hypothetical protein